jgi:raffinose/stachyose/melibiose transport system substrate-binding protein
MKKRIFIGVLLVIVSFSFSTIMSCKKADEEATVTFWHLDARKDQVPVWKKIADDFMKAHPKVTIKITVLENEAFKSKITTVMQSMTPPDLFRSWGGGQMNAWAEAGLLRDITSEVSDWPSTIGEGAIGVYSYLGKTYGLPYDMGAVGIWYNKELFKKAGISGEPKTWSALLDAVKKLKAAGITPIALGEGDKWPGHFWWVYLAIRLGGKEAFDAAYSGSGSFKDEPFVQAGVKLKELTALKPFQKGFLSATYGNQASLMGNGKAAMELMGQWAPDAQAGNSTSKKGIGDKLGFFPFPAVEGGKGKLTDTMGGGNGLILGKNAPDAAVEFLKYITSVEVSKYLAKDSSPVSIIPTVKGAEVVMKDPLKKQVQQLVQKSEYYQLYYDQYLPSATGEVVKDITQGLFAGKMTPEKAAEKLDKSFKAEKK